MKKLILLLSVTFSLNIFSQETEKTVTLVVSSQGETQEEAKQNALRSAIEQAFGAFVSSKTEIFNDSLIKDEIISISNGNIQKFEIISEFKIPDGDFTISILATVSVSKLTSFAESKGVVIEFKGSLLAANVKQQILNEQNEIKSIQNITKVCKEILDRSCDFEIKGGEPIQENNDNNQWSVPLTINVKFNKNINQFNQYLYNSIKALSMPIDEINKYNQLGKKTYKIALGGKEISGLTSDIEYLKKIAKIHTNLRYEISPSKVKFNTSDINEIERKLNKLNKNGYKSSANGSVKFFEIKYYETINDNEDPIFHFRSYSTIISIIDLIEYTKHSIMNFEITNGIDTISIDNHQTYSFEGGYRFVSLLDFKIKYERITPFLHILTLNEQSKYFLQGLLSGLTTLIGPINLRKKGIYLYEHIDDKDKKYYNLDEKYYTYNYSFSGVRANNLIYYDEINVEFPFIHKGSYMSNINNLEVVISLFDYKSNNENIISLTYEDKLTLSQIEKVQEYKIKLNK